MIAAMLVLMFALILVGGLATLFAASGARAARTARYFGSACFFAGIGALLLSGVPMLVLELVFEARQLAVTFFFVGYLLGLSGGAWLGLRSVAGRRLR